MILAMLGVCSALSAQPVPTGLRQDPRLKTQISMRLKTASLTEFTDQLQRLTKVHFSVASDIQERKVTAIFHDRTAEEVMARLQDAMFMEWRKVGRGYRLVLPSTVDREEQEIVAAENDAIRSGLLQRLRMYAEVAGISKDDLSRRKDDLKARIAKLRSEGSPDADDRIADLQQTMRMLNSASAPALCSALREDLARVTDALLEGKTICASTRPEDPVAKLPPTFMDHIQAHSPDALSAIVMMRYNAVAQVLEGRTAIQLGPRQGNEVTEFFTYRPLPSGIDTARFKLIVRLTKWSARNDPSVLDRPIAQSALSITSSADPAPGPGNGFSLAEHLEYLADRADVPVIGDAFRVAVSRDAYQPGMTIREYLANLLKAAPPGGTQPDPLIGWVVSKEGWVLARHAGYWRRLATEIPESVIRPMENAAKTKDYPTTDDYARFAGKLTYVQANGLENNPRSVLMSFQAGPLQHALGSLRLWDTLSEPQKAATQGAGLDLADLSSSQAQIVLDGWAEQMWFGRLPVELWAACLSPRGFAKVKPVLTYHVENFSPGGAVGFAGRPGTRPQRPPPPRLTPGGQEQVQFTYRLSDSLQLNDLYIVQKVRP